MGLGETLPRGEVPAPSSLHWRLKKGAISLRLEVESAWSSPAAALKPDCSVHTLWRALPFISSLLEMPSGS